MNLASPISPQSAQIDTCNGVFHHVITIRILEIYSPSWCDNLYGMSLLRLAVYAISIKNPQVSIYIACVAVVFCLIQHRSISFYEDHHRSYYLVHQHGGYFPFSLLILKVMSHKNALYTLLKGTLSLFQVTNV